MSFWDNLSTLTGTDFANNPTSGFVKPDNFDYVYEMKNVGSRGGERSIEDKSKPPIGYRYDNGQSQYVYTDLQGRPIKTVNRKGGVAGAIQSFSEMASSDAGKAMIAAALAGYGINEFGFPTGGGESAVGNIAGLGGAGGDFAGAVGTTATGSGAAAMSPAALESLAGTAGYGVNAAAGAGSGLGAYATNLGATAAGAAGATTTPWYLTPTALQTGAGIVGGLIQNASQRQAASMQSDAAQRAIDLQAQINQQQMALNAPFYNAGLTGQNRLMELLGLGGNTGAAGYGKYGRDFSMADYQADPGYAFRLSEGMKQLGHQAAGRGGLISGGTMKGLQDYAQNSASQEYNNAFQRYQTNRANQLQPLGNLQNVGISAANQQSSALGNYGSNVSNLLGQQGNANAAGALGQGNTINNAIGSGITAYQNNALVEQLRRVNPSIYGGPQ